MGGLSRLWKLLVYNWCPVPKATSQQSCNSKIGVIATISDRNCSECGSILGHCCLPPVLSTGDKIDPAGRRPPPTRPPISSPPRVQPRPTQSHAWPPPRARPRPARSSPVRPPPSKFLSTSPSRYLQLRIVSTKPPILLSLANSTQFYNSGVVQEFIRLLN